MAKCPTTGLWADSTVPHRDWELADCEVNPDFAPFMRCQMCGSDDVPDHHLEYYKHKDHSDFVAAGVCCSGFMSYGPDEGWRPPPPNTDYEADRAAWGQREWVKGEGDNDYTFVYDFVVRIIMQYEPNGMLIDRPCKLFIQHMSFGPSQMGEKIYKNRKEAKAAAFDAVMWATKKLRPSYPVPLEGWGKYWAIAPNKPWNAN